VELNNLAPSAAASELQWEQVVRAYKELGEGSGPVWAIETHGNNLTDSLKGCQRLLREVNSPRVKLTYQWLTDAGIEEGLDALWDHVAQVHLQYASGAGEERSRRCLRRLADRGYQGYVTIEFCADPIWETAPKELAIVKEYL
jgi:sugar phosphate isomerase/epimerase